MKRQRKPPDTRLDWRDPDMPVLDDGIEKTPVRMILAIIGIGKIRNE